MYVQCKIPQITKTMYPRFHSLIAEETSPYDSLGIKQMSLSANML